VRFRWRTSAFIKSRLLARDSAVSALCWSNFLWKPSATAFHCLQKIPPGAVILAFLDEFHLASAQTRTGSTHRTMSPDTLSGIVDTASYDRYIQHSMFSQGSRVMAIVRDRKSALLIYPATLPWIKNWPVESSASGRMRGCSYRDRSSATP
jgi:hypothetical protein